MKHDRQPWNTGSPVPKAKPFSDWATVFCRVTMLLCALLTLWLIVRNAIPDDWVSQFVRGCIGISSCTAMASQIIAIFRNEGSR